MGDFAWLIEAPGPFFLATRFLGGAEEFFWTKDHRCALRFCDQKQADGLMMAVRNLKRELFSFAEVLQDARPVEHAWVDAK